MGILIHSLVFHIGNRKRVVIKFMFQSIKEESRSKFYAKSIEQKFEIFITKL